MEYRPAYQNLLEIFPQVDSRILKAVAIEHSDDFNAAVEFILCEVLPSLSGPSEASDTVHNAYEVANEVQLREQDVENRGTGAIQPESIAGGTSVSGYSTSFICPFSGVAEEVIIDLETDNHNSSLPISVEHPGIIRYGSLVKDINDSVRECEVQLSNSVEGSDSVSNESVRECEVQLSNLVEGSDSVSVALGSVHDMSSSINLKSKDSVEDTAEVQKDVNISTSSEIEHHSEYLAWKYLEQVTRGTEVISLEEDDLPMTLSTRSGHAIDIGVLEESITEAKNYKKTLVSTMESVVNMMKEVELLEKEAKQAEEEGAIAGQDILAKAEELKKTLQHAQQANDMHAGEVYGEKAILTTEARECQCRLLNLSDRRDKILSITDKVRETLEARQAAIKDRIAAAKQAKLEKEGMARKAYKEQEAFLDTVVEESKRLQQEAEKNAKLRDFLVDRSQVLDALQGELLVICEDANLLYKTVDEHASLKGSLLMSTYNSASVSSSASRKSISSTDGLCLPMDLVENTGESNGDPWRVQEHGSITNRNGTEGAGASSEQKSASDDELKKSVDEHEWRDPLTGSLLMRTYSSASRSSSARSICSTDGVLLPIGLAENTGERSGDNFSVQGQEDVINTSGSQTADVSCEQQKSISDDGWEFLKHEVCPS